MQEFSKQKKVQTLESHQHFSFLSFPKTNKNTNNLPSFFVYFLFYFGTSLFTSDDALHVQTKKGYDYFPHFHRCTTTRERTNPSSICSWSIGHIWEHEFCHLGCWVVKEKFLKRRNFCLSKQLFEVVFSCFEDQKFNFSIFFLYCSVRTKKLLNKKQKKIEKKLGKKFLGEK